MNWTLSPDRCFDPDPSQRAMARELYASVKDLPIVSPHGHVDPTLLSEDDKDSCQSLPERARSKQSEVPNSGLIAIRNVLNPTINKLLD